jgi:hypothetical protein
VRQEFSKIGLCFKQRILIHNKFVTFPVSEFQQFVEIGGLVTVTF